MPNTQNLLVARGTSNTTDDNNNKTSTGPTPLTIGLLAALICLVLISVCSVGTLFAIRRYRNAKKAQGVLPTYEDDMLSVTSKPNHHRRGRSSVTINFKTNATPTFTVSEKEGLAEKAGSKTYNTLPEIRITFPEEIDETGKRQSGRVVVVHLNEHGGVGLEPTEEDLPAYQLQSNTRFQSLDLDRIGGLREKEIYSPPSQ